MSVRFSSVRFCLTITNVDRKDVGGCQVEEDAGEKPEAEPENLLRDGHQKRDRGTHEESEGVGGEESQGPEERGGATVLTIDAPTPAPQAPARTAGGATGADLQAALDAATTIPVAWPSAARWPTYPASPPAPRSGGGSRCGHSR